MEEFSGKHPESTYFLISKNITQLSIVYIGDLFSNSSTMTKRNYMNPYVAGILLGLVLLSAMFFSGRGLGASGGIKYAVVAAVDAVAPEHAQQSAYYSSYFDNGEKPLKNWLVFEVLGMVLGGFFSGAISGRL